MSNVFEGIKTDDSITYGQPADNPPNWEDMKKTGGRRHKGSKKMHKGKRHGNASLRAWVTFVKKVQKEEGVSYKEAMMRAKQRKDKGEKWRGGAPEDEESEDLSGMMGGRKRRRTKRAHRRTRSHRRSRRHH